MNWSIYHYRIRSRNSWRSLRRTNHWPLKEKERIPFPSIHPSIHHPSIHPSLPPLQAKGGGGAPLPCHVQKFEKCVFNKNNSSTGPRRCVWPGEGRMTGTDSVSQCHYYDLGAGTTAKYCAAPWTQGAVKLINCLHAMGRLVKARKKLNIFKIVQLETS